MIEAGFFHQFEQQTNPSVPLMLQNRHFDVSGS